MFDFYNIFRVVFCLWNPLFLHQIRSDFSQKRRLNFRFFALFKSVFSGWFPEGFFAFPQIYMNDIFLKRHRLVCHFLSIYLCFLAQKLAYIYSLCLHCCWFMNELLRHCAFFVIIYAKYTVFNTLSGIGWLSAGFSGSVYAFFIHYSLFYALCRFFLYFSSNSEHKRRYQVRLTTLSLRFNSGFVKLFLWSVVIYLIHFFLSEPLTAPYKMP